MKTCLCLLGSDLYSSLVVGGCCEQRRREKERRGRKRVGGEPEHWSLIWMDGHVWPVWVGEGRRGEGEERSGKEVEKGGRRRRNEEWEGKRWGRRGE